MRISENLKNASVVALKKKWNSKLHRRERQEVQTIYSEMRISQVYKSIVGLLMMR